MMNLVLTKRKIADIIKIWKKKRNEALRELQQNKGERNMEKYQRITEDNEGCPFFVLWWDKKGIKTVTIMKKKRRKR